MKQIILVAVIVFIGVSAQKTNPTSYDEAGCELKFLKDGSFIPKTFPSQPPTTSCDNLDSTVSVLFSRLRKEYEKLNYNGECMEKAFKNAKIQKFWFLRKAFAKASHLPQAEKDKKVKEFKEQEVKTAAEILVPCFESNKFVQLFDFLYNESVNDQDLEEDYCVRQYVSDNNLIDRRYNLKPNPKNIKTAKINCELLLKENRKSSEQSFTDERGYSVDKKFCINIAFRKGNYFNNLAVVNVMKGTDVTNVQLNSERTKFVEAMTKFTKDILPCVSE